MAITIGDTLKYNSAVPSMDWKYGPYDSISSAYNILHDANVICAGLTVGVKDSTTGEITEYWFKSGTTVDDLVEKMTAEITVDTSLDAASPNPVSNSAVTTAINAIPTVEVDSSLSSESDNPISNKAVASAIGTLTDLTTDNKDSLVSAINEMDSAIDALPTVTVDAALSEDSSNAISNKAVTNAIDAIRVIGTGSNLCNPDEITAGIKITGSWGSEISETENSTISNSGWIPVTYGTTYASNFSVFYTVIGVGSSGKVTETTNSATTITEDWGTYYQWTPSNNSTIKIRINYLTSWGTLKFETEEDVLANGGFSDYAEGAYELSNRFSGSIDETYLADSLIDKIEGIDREVAETLTVTEPYATLEGASIDYKGTAATNTFWTGWNVNTYYLHAGETIKAYTNNTTSDSSNVAMSLRFANMTVWKNLYNIGDYSTTPMEYTASNQCYVMVFYKVANGLTVTITRSFDTLEYAEENRLDKSLLRYRYDSAICVGDSLTEGKQAGDTGTASRECYPTYLAKMTGMTVTNAGQSGATASSWWNTWQSTYDYSNYECAFICLGTNGGVVADSDNYTAYQSIITKMKTDNEDIAIFLIDCVGANSDGTSANDVIKSLADANDLGYLSVFRNEAFKLSGTNNADVTPTHDIEGDPTHLSPMGYLVMASLVVKAMCDEMYTNMQRYNQRHAYSAS